MSRRTELTPTGELPFYFHVEVGRVFEFLQELSNDFCLILQHMRVTMSEHYLQQLRISSTYRFLSN